MIDQMETSSSTTNGTSEGTVKISFGMKRKEVTQLIVPASEVTSVKVDSDEEQELQEQANLAKRRKIERMENGIAPRDEDETKKDYVIPVVVESDWRVTKLLDKKKNGTITEEETARLAILAGDQVFNFEETSKTTKHVIKIGGDEVNVAEDADYKNIPIEHFGLAILRGCGWKEGAGIGRNPQVIPLQVNAQRPKGLGLGATPKHPDQQKSGNKKDNEETSGEIVRDSLVKVVSGRNHVGKYGKVQSRDDDNNSAFIKLALGGETVRVALFSLQKVTKKEYERDGKCLNKQEYDSAKAKIDKKREEMEKNIRKKERREDDDDIIVISEEGSSRDVTDVTWVRPDLIIRFIDNKYNKGQLYKQKLRVVDVASKNEISLEDDYGQIFYNLRQSWMETVIPRDEGGRIMVVRGKYKGSSAIMEKKDKRKDRVVARLLDRDNKITDLGFDDVCLFKPKYEEDYDL